MYNCYNSHLSSVILTLSSPLLSAVSSVVSGHKTALGLSPLSPQCHLSVAFLFSPSHAMIHGTCDAQATKPRSHSGAVMDGRTQFVRQAFPDWLVLMVGG